MTTNIDRDHRWSGWPGALCLDCFTEDQTEWCLAQGCLAFEENPDDPEHPIIRECTEHQQAACPARLHATATTVASTVLNVARSV
jgi:hypothetical protein